MSDDDAIGEGPELTDLAGAARATGRQAEVILAWIRKGEFAPDEAYQLEEMVRGRGAPWAISMRALRRVHHRHVGSRRWDPQLATPAGGTHTYLLEENVRLREENARLRAALGLAPSGSGPAGWGAPLRALHEHAGGGESDQRAWPPARARRARSGRGGSGGTGGGVPDAPPSTWGGPPLPDGYVAVSTWCDDHNVNQRSLQRLIAQQKVPAPLVAPEGRPWYRAQNPVKYAYDRERHAAACAAVEVYAQTHPVWAARFQRSCGPDCPYRPAVAAEVDEA